MITRRFHNCSGLLFVERRHCNVPRIPPVPPVECFHHCTILIKLRMLIRKCGQIMELLALSLEITQYYSTHYRTVGLPGCTVYSTV